MPYISKERRKAIWGESTTDMDNTLKNAGELNYFITCIVHDYIKNNGKCYQTFNDIMGALEGAKLELYRRHIAPYENVKLAENGDVPDDSEN